MVSFQTVSEAYDCVSILKEYGYTVQLQNSSQLPSVVPNEQNNLPSFPGESHFIEEDSLTQQTCSSIDMPSLFDSSNEEELVKLLKIIKTHPNYYQLAQKIRQLLNMDN